MKMTEEGTEKRKRGRPPKFGPKLPPGFKLPKRTKTISKPTVKSPPKREERLLPMFGPRLPPNWNKKSLTTNSKVKPANSKTKSKRIKRKRKRRRKDLGSKWKP